MKRIALLLLLIIDSALCHSQTSCPTTLTDQEGNTYKTILLGEQCWMAENMRTTIARDGKPILYGSKEERHEWGYLYSPDNRISLVPQYGYLYDRDAAEVICPKGWHLPSDADWTLLSSYLSTHSQYCCGSKSANNAKGLASPTGWNNSTNTCTAGNGQEYNNTTGFNALPAGFSLNPFEDRLDEKEKLQPFYFIEIDGNKIAIDDVFSFGKAAFFWSSTPCDISAPDEIIQWITSDSYGRAIYYDRVGIIRDSYEGSAGLSVRCIHD